MDMFIESITPEELQKLEFASFPGKITVIDSVGAEFNRAIAYLRSQKVIGFDTETRPTFTPSQPRYNVSLLQLSGPDKAFLFRLNRIGMHRRLCNLLASEKIVKVGAAIHDDIRGLQVLHGFKAAGFVDLQKIGWEWGIRDKAVKKMTAIILGFRISKTQQLSNWEAVNLSESQCKYAATDAWVCREMYLKLLASEKNPLDLSATVEAAEESR
ncbi:MAG: 3'-5' exonuclease domain-containing protein 2 [Bacteroidales bacterium]|nr:3'-5' exonuclease domain-containing protein 2 [Bacteroidales bacterium]